MRCVVELRAWVWLLAVLLASTWCSVARGQWSADAASNTLLAGGGTGNAVLQAKVRLSPTRDGGAYVSWWQSEDAPVYWSLRLNRLDRTGVKRWASDLVVSAQAQVSTAGAQLTNGSFYDVNYDLITDADDHAVLVFTDFRLHATRDVFAQRVSPAGALVWGAGGVTITDSAIFKRDPRIVQTTGGFLAVAWFESSSPPALRMQVVNAGGVVQFATGGIALATASTASRPPDRLEIRPSSDGGVLAAWVAEFSTSTSANRSVVAQKLMPPTFAGAWNAGVPVTVSAANISVQTQTQPFASNYPRVALAETSDGGCVVAAFPGAIGARNVVVSRLNASGQAVWPGSLLAVSNATGVERIEPVLAVDAASQATWIFWRELGAGVQAVGAQRVSAGGVLELGASGVLVTPMDANYRYALRSMAAGSGAMVFWMQEPVGSTSGQTLAGARLDATGVPGWSPTVRDVCSTVSVKNLVRHPLDATSLAGIARDGFVLAASYPAGAMLAWEDARSDGADVYAQQINTCGTLGRLGLADADASGRVDVPDIFAFLGWWFAGDTRADADGTGAIEVADIFAFLSAYFVGC